MSCTGSIDMVKEERYKVKDGFLSREIAGEVLLIPVGEQTTKLNGMIMFSESGAFLWRLIEKGYTKAEMIFALAKEYDKVEEEVSADVEEFLEKAVARELIDKIEE